MFGGYAQFVSRPESYWIKVRPDLDLDQGAAAMWPWPPPTASSPTDLTCG
jgi:hypothetical protein